MLYFPLLDQFAKYEKFLYDLFVQIVIIVAAYLIDSTAYYRLGYDNTQLSLLVFILGYLGARATILAIGKSAHFSAFVRYGPGYTFVLAIGNWLVYLLALRWRLAWVGL